MVTQISQISQIIVASDKWLRSDVWLGIIHRIKNL